MIGEIEPVLGVSILFIKLGKRFLSARAKMSTNIYSLNVDDFCSLLIKYPIDLQDTIKIVKNKHLKYLEIIDYLEHANIKDENMKNTIKNIQNTESYIKKLNYIELDEKLLKIDTKNISFDKDKDNTSPNEVVKKQKYVTNKFFGEMKFLRKNESSLQGQEEGKFKTTNIDKKSNIASNKNIHSFKNIKNSVDVNSIELIDNNVQEISNKKQSGDFKDYLTKRINGFYNNYQFEKDESNEINRSSENEKNDNNKFILNNINKQPAFGFKRLGSNENKNAIFNESSFNSNSDISKSPKERKVSKNKFKTKKIIQELKGYKNKVKNKKQKDSDQFIMESNNLDQEVYQENIFKIVGHFDNFINLIENLNNTFEKMNDSLKKLKKDNSYYFDKMFRIDEKLNDLEEKQFLIEEKLKIN